MKKHITTGENLKNIRKTFNLEQYELVGGKISQNIIALIENDTTPIYEPTAKLISENINKIITKTNSDILIDTEDILYPERFKTKKIGQEYIKKLRFYIKCKEYDMLENKLPEIENFLSQSQWDLPRIKYFIYKMIGTYYYNNYNYTESYMYITKAFENSLKVKNYTFTASTIASIICVCIKLKKYKQGIEYANFIQSFNSDIPSNLIYSILYNKILCHKNLNQFDICMNLIDELQELNDKSNLENDTSIMLFKGIIYKDNKQYDKSLEIYTQLIPLIPEDMVEMKSIVLANIIEIYRLLNYDKYILEYFKLFKTILKHVDTNSPYLAQFYLEVGLTYNYLNDYKNAEEYLLKALEYGKKLKDLKTITTTVDNLVDLFSKNKNIEKMNLIKNEMLFLMKHKLIGFYSKQIIKITSFFNNLSETEKVNDILNFYLEYEERI